MKTGTANRQTDQEPHQRKKHEKRKRKNEEQRTKNEERKRFAPYLPQPNRTGDFWLGVVERKDRWSLTSLERDLVETALGQRANYSMHRQVRNALYNKMERTGTPGRIKAWQNEPASDPDGSQIKKETL